MKSFKTKPILIGAVESAVIFTGLVYILALFYLLLPNEASQTFSLSWNSLIGLLYVSMITDGLILLVHLPRRQSHHENALFDSNKVTVLIACYNGEAVIGETISNALKKVDKDHILVASDGSKDKTVEIAQSYGVTVLDFQENMQKAHTISRAIHHVKTPYVLILDDDTHIDQMFIPTSLLDEGYDAVAFAILPEQTGTLANKFQTFEYRRSMFIGKSLRGNVGAVGNVSGAIGLFHTQDLVEQDGHHSGQWGGEDQQRTMLVHLKRKHKGVTFFNSVVTTKAPDSFKALTKQRTKIWNRACHELFWLNFKVAFTPNSHYLLKLNRAYYLYVLLTDPIRILMLWSLLLYPINILVNYVFYLLLNLVYWFKLGRADSLWVVALYPIYSKYNTICRFYAHIHWFEVKYNFYKRKLHTRVNQRKIALEYVLTSILLFCMWVLAARMVINAVKLEYINRCPIISEIQKDISYVIFAGLGR